MAEMREDRGELDLTLQIEKLKKRVREAEGEMSIVKGIGMNSPEMRAMKKINRGKRYSYSRIAYAY